MLLDLAESLRTAAEKAEAIANTITTNFPVEGPPVDEPRVFMDRRLLTVRWNGRMCHLGNTIPFRLMERLARRPNQYLTHEQLLEEIWGGPRSKSAVRSAINSLRSRLVAAGMSDLADAIDGSNAGCYGLILQE